MDMRLPNSQRIPPTKRDTSNSHDFTIVEQLQRALIFRSSGASYFLLDMFNTCKSPIFGGGGGYLRGGSSHVRELLCDPRDDSQRIAVPNSLEILLRKARKVV
jgi:hypothetical protein